MERLIKKKRWQTNPRRKCTPSSSCGYLKTVVEMYRFLQSMMNNYKVTSSAN